MKDEKKKRKKYETEIVAGQRCWVQRGSVPIARDSFGPLYRIVVPRIQGSGASWFTN